MRFHVLAVVVACASGCMSAITSTQEVDYPARHAQLYVPVLSDSVFALGRLDAASARQLGLPDAVVFLGRKHTYVLENGGRELRSIAAELDGTLVHLDNPPRTLFLKEKTAWGSLSVVYGEKNRAYSSAETEALARLGFVVRTDGLHERKIPVKGALYPAVSLSGEQAQRFKQNRQIDFYNPADIPPPTKLHVPPAAVAIDIVTLPVQLLGGLIVVGVAVTHPDMR